MVRMQALDSYTSINLMLNKAEALVKENKLDSAQQQLLDLDKELKIFCTTDLVQNSVLTYDSAVKLNERFSNFILQLETAKKKTAKALLEQVSNRKKISAYRGI